MTTVIVTPANPPSLSLVTTGAGTLTSVTTPKPDMQANPAPAVDLRVSFYDLNEATPAAVKAATPIASVGTSQGYAVFPFDAGFENGLVVVIDSTSSIEVQYTGG